ncbi:hypothetical protein ABAC460_00170 [Asticcacaulis sp. AC460]|uniref:SGNH/GDSL hydrolase family protein n=1 Tax=Asticcacaulis sp. AC460 TaxID=1282360 RepID=UPI0003C3DEA3|nr:SGNH/GDSL hydrolase family protein [Asticcacaulis sp. AC460]ESQ93516.1 hypothetical protein ABAC460_00170 [Asticcacaulis sp. AC460]
MERQHFKTVVIGGSNSVIKTGYLVEAVKNGKNLGLDLDIIEDMAIGGTTILNGLFRLKRSKELANADVLIIEYALNDTPTYAHDMRSRSFITHWARAYEGVIRYARTVNPNIRIISMILEAKTPLEKRQMNLVYAGVHYLSSYYGTELIDVASAVLRSVGSDRAFTNEFYKDGFHYKPTVFKSTAGMLLSQLMTPPRQPLPLPEPLDPRNFSEVSAWGVEDLDSAWNLPLKTYENSKFSFDALMLGEKDLSFTLEDGKLLALIYINDPDTGIVHYQVDDQYYASYMQKPGVRSGAFPFIVGMLSCEFLHPKQLMVPERTRSYRISARDMGEPLAKLYRPKANVFHTSPDNPTLALTGLLYTGTLTDLKLLEPAEDRVLETA